MKEFRKQVVIEVVGPIQVGPFTCRKSLGYCGEALPEIYHIAGVGADGPKYWLCPRCGCHEVVVGTPMNFGEVPKYDEIAKMLKGNL